MIIFYLNCIVHLDNLSQKVSSEKHLFSLHFAQIKRAITCCKPAEKKIQYLGFLFPLMTCIIWKMYDMIYHFVVKHGPRRKSRYLRVALNICDRAALSNMYIRKHRRRCLRARRTWARLYENRLIPYNHGRIIISSAGDTRHLVRQERQNAAAWKRRCGKWCTLVSSSPRYMSGDPHSYGAIEFSSPRRRALNIHTVRRNRVPGVPSHTSSLSHAPPPSSPQRALCALPCIDHRRDCSGCSLLPAPAEFKPRVHDRSRLHLSKSNIPRRKKLHRMTYIVCSQVTVSMWKKKNKRIK